MKKSILILTAVVSLLAFPAFGQTISISGSPTNTSEAFGAGTPVNVQLTVTSSVAEANITGVTLDLRIATASAGFFGVNSDTPNSPFSQTNSTSGSFPASFSTAGDANNSGFSITGLDLGSNRPSPGGTVTSPGTFFETLQISVASNTPAGVYTFSATAGGTGDVTQGSWITNSAGGRFSVNSFPTFTITIVPEPATWSLLGLGGLGSLGLTLLRARRTS